MCGSSRSIRGPIRQISKERTDSVIYPHEISIPANPPRWMDDFGLNRGEDGKPAVVLSSLEVIDSRVSAEQTAPSARRPSLEEPR